VRAPSVRFTVFKVVVYALSHYFFFLLSDATRLGLPAGCPRRFFCAIRDFFSAAVISPEVLGVLLETRFVGLQYGVPRLSPSLRPQALPVLTSFQSSLNHRFRALPFSVLRTATGFLLSALGDSTRSIRRREDFIRCLHLAVTIVFDRTAFLKRNGLHFAHAPALHHRIVPLVRPRIAQPSPTQPPALYFMTLPPMFILPTPRPINTSA